MLKNNKTTQHNRNAQTQQKQHNTTNAEKQYGLHCETTQQMNKNNMFCIAKAACNACYPKVKNGHSSKSKHCVSE